MVSRPFNLLWVSVLAWYIGTSIYVLGTLKCILIFSLIFVVGLLYPSIHPEIVIPFYAGVNYSLPTQTIYVFHSTPLN